MEGMWISIFAIMFGAFGAGNAIQFMPDVGKGFMAAISLFEILDAKTEQEL